MNIIQNSHLRTCTVFFFLLIVGIICSYPSLAQKKKKQAAPPVTEQKLILTNEDGTSRYRIVLPSTPTESESKAATILQDYLIQISGAVLPIIGAEKAWNPYEIVLGQNDRIDELGLNINYNELQQDGFLIKTDSARLIIAGGSGKGTLYGVYTLLEKYLNCRMYAPSAKRIPLQKHIVLDKIEDKQVPDIRFRSIHYKSTWDAEYVDWHKLSHDENGERKDWGMWVHTFNALVPPEVFFVKHPNTSPWSMANACQHSYVSRILMC
ncbi:MAG: alpha-glucuronidase family glycosyl hydrolase [Cyclobacteriaceae bacterium]|nr:alpha-glucuronidase family glycosyl hydrolase [Cyclobacteriaceae bacterium]